MKGGVEEEEEDVDIDSETGELSHNQSLPQYDDEEAALAAKTLTNTIIFQILLVLFMWLLLTKKENIQTCL